MAQLPDFSESDKELAFRVFDKILSSYGMTPLADLPEKSKPSAGTRWFFTITKPEGITQAWFKANMTNVVKTHITRAMACMEHHQSGKLHAHMIVEMEKPFFISRDKT